MSQLFNIAQTFQIPTSIADPRDTVYISSIDVYFKYRPSPTDTKSSIQNPGVTLFVSDTVYNVPRITQSTYSQTARLEYSQIVTSSDASAPSKFKFTTPIGVTPGQLYSFMLSYDGNEVYFPWLAKNGSWIVGTRNIFSGMSPNFVGNYYEYVTPADGVSDPLLAKTQQDFTSFWRSLSDSQLTFEVNLARYYINGVPVTSSNSVPNSAQIHIGVPVQTWDNISGDVVFDFPSNRQEGISFDISSSTVQSFVGAQRVYQNTVFYPGGYANGSSSVSVSTSSNSSVVTANTNLPNGSVFNWNTVFNNYTGSKYVTFFDTTKKNIRRVVSIVSNSQIVVDEPLSFTNTAAKFMVSPVATIDSIFPSSPQGKNQSFMWLSGSTANSTVRFVNNAIENIAIGVGGSGYNNSDVLYVVGYENVTNKVTGGYVAVANIVTNSSGGITAVYQSNLGCGFVNSSSIAAVVANSTHVGNTASNTSTGSGATFTYTVGSTISTEFNTNIFKKCIVNNFGVNDVMAFFDATIPVGTSLTPTLSTIYYTQSDSNVYSGQMFYVGTPQTFDITINQRTRLASNTVAAFVSFSNEFVAHYANGTLNDKVSSANIISNTFVLNIIATSNNDYVCPSIDTAPGIEFGRFIINNDYTKEETDAGNAWAKHLTTHINFTRLSEDIRVYLTAYRPPNTNFQVYARIQNSSDPDNFNQADWTRLQMIDGNSVFSSTSTTNDYVELTYGFQSTPNTNFTLTGSIGTTNNSSVITGFNTTFSSNLVANTLVKIYDPLFSGSNYITALVTAVTNNTSLTIDRTILSTDNPALIANSLRMDVLSFPHQAFTDNLSDNVARYYDTKFIKYQGYDNMQIKVVMLSSNQSAIPGINNIRVIGVSA